MAEKGRKNKPNLTTLIIAVGFILTAFSSLFLIGDLKNDLKAQSEYESLRELAGSVIVITLSPPIYEVYEVYNYSCEEPEQIDIAVSIPDFAALAEINPDIVGWIMIPGTNIDYPIVQCRDNDFYLHTTFGGARNPAGAIFMDYRTTFDDAMRLIHGHNMRDGSMFSALNMFLCEDFSESFRDIIIITADEEIKTYTIFEVRPASAWDALYTLDFSDSDLFDMGQVLALSTCLEGGGRHDRLLVLARMEQLHYLLACST
jgi:sortase B